MATDIVNYRLLPDDQTVEDSEPDSTVAFSMSDITSDLDLEDDLDPDHVRTTEVDLDLVSGDAASLLAETSCSNQENATMKKASITSQLPVW